MKKTKLEKGITLIALIITIVVLLILAVVSIGAIKNSKIITHSQNAADEYIVAQEKEQLQLAVMEWQLQKNIQGDTKTFKATIEEALIGKGAEVGQADNENGPLTVTFTKTKHVYKLAKDGTITVVGSSEEGGTDNPSGSEGGSGGETVMPVATIDVVVSENSTINGEAYSSNNPVIPKGFKAINVTTAGHESSWTAENGPEVSKGLVISDGTSEFVWIPVETLDEFARVTSDKDANGNTNYQGVLYDFSGTTATEMTSYGQSTTSYREPANLSTTYDSTSKMSIWTETLYQESFNKMVKSVAKYGGFYVGRYETSMNGSKAQSKSGETPMKGVDWYTMYTNSQTYSTSGVISEMIWGCQWDAMLKFILTGNEARHVTAKTNVGHKSSDFSSTPYKTGGTNYSGVYSGSTTYNDIASNIYDLEGNVWEWTQEAISTNYRGLRGGDYLNSFFPSYRTEIRNVPTKGSFSGGSRLSLFVEL